MYCEQDSDIGSKFGCTGSIDKLLQWAADERKRTERAWWPM